MVGQVTKWVMSPEELAEYVKRHPIRPSKPKRKQDKAFSNIGMDYKWRGGKRCCKQMGELNDNSN